MSEYTVCETKFKDPETLKEALIGLGVDENHIEEHKEPQNLSGFQGDSRQQKAHIIIRRKNVGTSSNDIGFERQSDGTYKAWVSDYDRSRGIGKSIIEGKLAQGYSRRIVEKEVARTRGWAIKQSETLKDGKLRIKIRVRS